MTNHEKNFEDFVRQIEFDDTPDPRHRDELEHQLLLALKREPSGRTAVWRTVIKSRGTKIAVAVAIIIAAILIGAKVFTGPAEELEKRYTTQRDPKDEQPFVEDRHKDKPDYHLPDEPRLAADRLGQELDDIELMFAAGDIDGLVQMLRDAEFDQSKTLAANYLAKIGDLSEIEALQNSSKDWQGDPAANPFAAAIAAIEARTESHEPVAAVSVPEKIESQKSKFAPKGVLSGLVLNARTGEPISDLRILARGPDSPHCKTDANGFYYFDKVATAGEYRIMISSVEYVAFTDYYKMPIVSLDNDRQMVKHFQLWPACMIDIQAVNEQGEPFEKVRLVATFLADDRKRDVREAEQTDKDGMATLGGFEPADTPYLITATHEDYAAGKLIVRLNDPELIEFHEIVMRKGVDVEGYAQYSDGVPAEGLQVRATPDWWHCNSSPQGHVVNAKGYFTLSHVVPGAYSIHIYFPREQGGYGFPVRQAKLPPQEGLLTVNVPKKSPASLISISGTITYLDDQRPDYVDIHASSTTGSSGSANLSRYGQDGENDMSTFTIENLEPGTYTLTFSGEHLARKVVTNVKAPSSNVQVELQYEAWPRLQGTVLKAGSNEPVKQFKVRVKKLKVLRGAYYVQDDRWREFLTTDGKFDLDVTGPGVYQLQAAAEGFAWGLSGEINTDVNQAAIIELGSGGTLIGKVVDEKGTPISGAKVIPLSRAGGNNPRTLETFVSEEGAVETINGNFELKHLSAGTETIKVTHPDYSFVVVKDIEVLDGRESEPVEIVLTKGGTVEGYVYDAQGKPQANVTLYFQDASGYGGNDERAGRLATAVTDSNGFYRVEGLPEQMCFIRRSNEWESLGVVCRTFLPVNGKTVRIDFGGSPKISGRLIVDGQPLPDVKMLMGDAAVARFGGFKCYAVTGPEGQFTLAGPPQGRWAIYYEQLGKRNEWMKVAEIDVGADDMELGVVSPASLEEKILIQVKASDANETLDNISQIVIQKGREITGQMVGPATPVSGKKGLYSLESLLPGEYTATVYRAGLPMIRQKLEIEEGQQKPALTLQLPGGTASVSGLISRQSQLPLMIVSADQRIIAALEADSDGRYKVEHLPAGRYTVTRWPADERIGSPMQFTLTEGENRKFDIDVSRLAEPQVAFLMVQAVNEDGLVLTEPELWIEREGGYIEPTQKSSQGHAFMTRAGEYTLHVTCSGYEEVTRNVSLEPVDMENFKLPEATVIKLKKK
ncbi:MAG TPA: carboxypeptidase-like regulatory domain-containing protein [Sedimentisphaerales bacterium]|nr:carboxypeptidase-like regulatory domain-containing protein [Sedimentisphaerales bacterium]